MAMFKYMVASISKSMHQSKQSFTGLKDWQNAEIVLIGGTLVLTILLSSVGIILEQLSINQPVAYLISPSIFGIIVVLGFISGYIAKNQFVKTYMFTILLIVGIIMLLVLSDLIAGTRFLGLQSGSDLASTIMIATSTIIMLGFMTSFAISVFLLPSLFVGSKIAIYRKETL